MAALQSREWKKLEEVSSLLEPFASLTDLLQRGAQALSSIIPSILDLDCHLQQSKAAKSRTEFIQCNLRHRFETMLESNSINFNSLLAAACRLDPSVSAVLNEDAGASNTLTGSQNYIGSISCVYTVNGQTAADADALLQSSNSASEPTGAPTLLRFKPLAAKIRTWIATTAATNTDSIWAQLIAIFVIQLVSKQ